MISERDVWHAVEMRAGLADAASALNASVGRFIEGYVWELAMELEALLWGMAGKAEDVNVVDRPQTDREGLSRADREGCWRLLDALRAVWTELDRVEFRDCKPLADCKPLIVALDGLG